jgi:hypothetical protein
VSSAGEDLQHVEPGKELARLPEERGSDAWADLRPAYRWIEGRRPILVAAIVLIAAQLLWRAQFLSRMYFYRQDFFNLDFAIRSPFSWHYLTYVGTGHLTIAERAIIWLLARISVYSWGLASAVSLAFLAAAGLAAFALLRTLFGERPAILVPLAIYLLSPLGIAAVGWWTVALESLPLQLALFMALNAHVRYVRTSRPRYLVMAACWVAFGMLSFEKGLAVPLLLFAVTAAFLVGGGSWIAAMLRALVRYRKAWLVYAVVMIGYVVVLASSLQTSTSRPVVPHASAVLRFSWDVVKDSLLPGAIGGPWQWWALPGRAYAIANPPAALTWLAFIIAVTIVGASLLRRRVSWRAWGTFAVWVVVADMLPVIIARLNWYPILLALDTRYVADAVPVLVICVGLAFLPVTDASEASAVPAPVDPRAGAHARPQPSSAERMWRSTASAVFAVFAVGAIWSAGTYEVATSGRPAASYIATAAQTVAMAPPGTHVLDGAVPDQVKVAANGTHAVIGVIQPGKLDWIEHPKGTIDGLRMFGPDGLLYPAWVYGAASGPPRSRHHGCFPERNGLIVVNFFHSSPYLSTVLRIGYIWTPHSAGQVNVSYGGTVHGLRVEPGLHAAYLPVNGPAPGISVAVPGGVRMCIGDAEAGAPGPQLPSQAQS